MDTLYIVVPCYNEEEILGWSAPVLRDKLFSLMKTGAVSSRSRLMLVDDGSQDSTWEIIRRLHRENDCIDGLKLSRNRGHQNAVVAGLATAVKYAGVTLTIDADLQDDVNAIDEMVEKYNRGCPIVCGVRRRRDSDTFFKRVTARGYYTLMRLAGARLIYDHADFRLMSRGAVLRLLCFGTEDLFLRGLITRLGLPVETVTYDRRPRTAGESKYTLKKMLHLARRGMECARLKPSKPSALGELYIETFLRH